MGEITIILVLALIFLGPKKLPDLASGLGKLIREIRKTTSDVKNEIQLDDAIRRPLEELREAVTLPPEELKRRDRLRREVEEQARRVAEEQAAALAAQASAGDGAAAGGDTAKDLVPPPPPPVTEPPRLTLPEIPGAPPSGTVARATAGTISGAVAAAAGVVSGPVPAVGSGEISERRLPGPASGPEGSRRTLRSVPVAEPPKPAPEPPPSAADRSNITQTLTEADLLAAAVKPAQPPPPPPFADLKSGPPRPPGGRPTPTRPPPLPGATAPKKSPEEKT